MEKFDLHIDKSETLRYLGYKGQQLDEVTEELLAECINEVKNVIQPRYTYEYKDIEETDEGVVIKGTKLILKGKDIKEHLKHSRKCVLMAVTLGNEIEKLMRLYEKTHLTRAFIMDSCATTAVEEICDIIEDKIRKDAEKEGKNITFRYSPGYGDLPLDCQKLFSRVLDTEKKIGLTVSENNIMIPRKSVTAIIGIISSDIKPVKKGCESCSNYKNCKFRKEGVHCGN